MFALIIRSICSTEDKDLVRDKLEKFFVPLAKAYNEICVLQKTELKLEFFGLRDFYRYNQHTNSSTAMYCLRFSSCIP